MKWEGDIMSDRDYLKSLIDALPEDKLDEAVSRVISISDEEFDEAKFKIVSAYILEKYHKAFEELAKCTDE